MSEKITVIIPTYNKAPFISETIESVFSQTYPNWEIVIVDDFSSDGTEAAVQKFLSEKVRYFRHERNWGPGATFNDGIEKARTEYVALIASDDVLLPKHLENVMACFRDENVETVFPRLKVINEHGKDLQKSIEPPSSDKYELLNRLFYVGNMLPSPGIAFKKSLFTKTAPFNPALIQMHDYDLNVRALLYGKTATVSAQTVLYRRFSSPFINLSADARWVEFCHKAERKVVLDNFLAVPPEEMKKIFPDLKNCPDEKMTFTFLTKSARHKDELISSWGFERLVSYIENHTDFFKGNDFNFQFKDYIDLYKVRARGVLGTTHKQRLFNRVKVVIKGLFGLK